MRSLTLLKERSHNTSIRRMPDSTGRAAHFRKSATNQIMTSEESQIRVKGEGLDKFVRPWDGQRGSMMSWIRLSDNKVQLGL